MNISVLSNDSNLTHAVKMQNKNNVSITHSDSVFLQEIFYTKNDLFIVDVEEDNLPKLLLQIKEETQIKNIPIIFILNNFDFKVFEQLGYALGEIDYLLKPIVANQLINKLNLYQDNIELKNKFEKTKDFVVQYSQYVIQAQMLGIISHHWRQPMNIIATSVINLELKSELEQLEHEDIENTAHKIHTVLEKTTNVIHDYDNLFQISSKKCEFDTIEIYNKCLDLILPQFRANKIKVENFIPKKRVITNSYQNELSQALLSLLSIMKDLILKQQKENNQFEGKLKLSLEEKNEQISFCIINKKIGIIKDTFHNGLNLNSLLKSSTSYYETKLFIAKQIIEYKLNGLLKIDNKNKDLIFTITI